MAISLNSNVSALMALRRIGYADSAISDAFLRLSSGLRINRPSDDSAGLAVASTLGVQQRIFSRAITNANDGLSMLNVAQGSAEQLSTVVVRLKELAQQAANGSLSSAQRGSLNSEAQKLTQEYNRLINSTRFNGLTIHGANQDQTNIQIGTGSSGTVGFALADALESTIGSGSFSLSGSLGEGVAVTDIVSADFNNDGISDLAFISSSNANLGIRLGNGDGTFKAASKINLGAGQSSLAAGDFDGDGWTDLVAADLTGGIKPIFNTFGTFAAGATTTIESSGNALDRIALVDVDGDGLDDLVSTANPMAGGLGYASISTGTGFKAPVMVGFLAGLNSTDLTVGDYNGDGLMDFATNSTSTSVVYIWISKSSAGSASFNQVTVSGIAAGQRLTSGDINGDGMTDLVAGNGTTAKSFINNGSSTFTASGNFNTGASSTTQLEMRDIDQDGIEDLLILDATGRFLHSLISNADGSFQTKVSSTLGSSNNRLAVDDFNGDGIADGLIGTSTGESLYVGDRTQTTRLLAVDLTTQSSAQDALDQLDTQLDKIGKELGIIGTAMSRINSALNVAMATRENYAAAESRITDVDTAQEAANLTRSQILQQSAAAVFAQANQLPSLALALLKF